MPGKKLHQPQVRYLFVAKYKWEVCHTAFSLHENTRPKQNNNSRLKKETVKNTNPNIPEIKFYLLNSGILEAKLFWIREVHCKLWESTEAFLFLCSLTVYLRDSNQNPISEIVLKWKGKANRDWNWQLFSNIFLNKSLKGQWTVSMKLTQIYPPKLYDL